MHNAEDLAQELRMDSMLAPIDSEEKIKSMLLSMAFAPRLAEPIV